MDNYIDNINKKYGTSFETVQDIKNFQKQYGLKVDGIVDKHTAKMIQDVQKEPLGPYTLPELTVSAKKPDTRNTWQKFWDNQVEYNPFFGKQRQRLVGKYYTKDNPFRQGNDFVGNLALSAPLTGIGLRGLGNMASYALAQGINTLPAVTAAVAGGQVGQSLFNDAITATTGIPWDQHLEQAGLNSYNRALFAPGAYAGSYLAGSAANQIVNNARPWLENSLPRMVMTPEGPIMALPGETITFRGRPLRYQDSGQGNFGYEGVYTTKSGGNRGRVQTHTGNTYMRIPGGVNPRMMRDIQKGKGRDFTMETEFSPYKAPGWAGFIPWDLSIRPEEVLGEDNFRLEEYKPYDDPFLKWYAKQPEGTTQFYTGDPNHRAGNYVIMRTKADPVSTVRVVGDDEGWVIPDSTQIFYNQYVNPQVNRLQGGVPDEAVRSSEKITGY